MSIRKTYTVKNDTEQDRSGKEIHCSNVNMLKVEEIGKEKSEDCKKVKDIEENHKKIHHRYYLCSRINDIIVELDKRLGEDNKKVQSGSKNTKKEGNQ